jgi:hypothetical protein
MLPIPIVIPEVKIEATAINVMLSTGSPLFLSIETQASPDPVAAAM